MCKYQIQKKVFKTAKVAISIYFLFEAELTVMSRGELNEGPVQFQ